MHCELVVPGLLATQAALRAPALELLMARGRRTHAQPATLEKWLFDRFAAPTPAAGAYTLFGAGGDPGEAEWARADPVHLRLLRERMIVMPAESFSLSQDEAATLSHRLREIAEIRVISARRWCLRLTDGKTLAARPAIDAAGEPAPLERTSDALLTEIQMALHEHPVNEAREARGEPAVNSLWLWGGGRVERLERSIWHSVLADDPLALGLARAAAARHAALPAHAAAWLERAPEEGRHLLVLDELRAPAALGAADDAREALERLERAWFAPLLAALRSGRAGMVTLHVPDAGAASFETIRGDLRRFWRRPRPLETYA
ncbi:MAG: hypothetical protein ACT4P4_15070 [Betaproteobacteria bacterium]